MLSRLELRIQNLKKKIPKYSAFLISNPTQIKYFTEFNFLVPTEREAYLVVTNNEVFLIYNSFSPIIRHSFCNYLPGAGLAQLKKNVEKIVEQTKIKILEIDPNHTFVSEADKLAEIKNLKVRDVNQQLISNIMMVKDHKELKNIKIACEITKNTFDEVKLALKVGMSEIEVAYLIKESFAKKINEHLEVNSTREKTQKIKYILQNDLLAFPTIVAFGKNSALPHYQPGEKNLEKNMVILMDFGVKFMGYCSDMTRTFWFGDKPSDEFLKVENIIKKAYEKSFELLNKSTSPTAKDLDNAARSFITNKGYGKNFIHTTGHGLGLDIHEQPSLSWVNKTPLLPNMVVTIEPGIYLDEKFGYRYENTVLVKKNSAEELTL
jgi:Xaa-Pro aminopeptidase